MSKIGLIVVVVLMSSPAIAQAQTTCPAEIEFTNPKTTLPPDGLLNLNLFTTVSKGACLPAEIRLTAAFYDSEQELICAGTIESIAVQNSNTQSTNFEIRPRNVVEFVRLKAPTNLPPKRLFCFNPEGNTEVSPMDIARAASVRLRATILPKAGGVATSEVRISF